MLSPALSTPRLGTIGDPRSLCYLLQQLQDAIPLPGQALSLLGALQPDLGDLGVQGGHSLLGRAAG